MFLTVHAAAGLAIAQHLKSPWLAFLCGFLTHPLLDAIPHGDCEFEPWLKRRPNTNKTLFLITLIDLTVLAILLLGLEQRQFFTNPAVSLAAVAGSLLIDFLVGLYLVFKIKWLKPIADLNHYSHHWLDSLYHRVGFAAGGLFQLVLALFFLTLL
jgi:hypothetical protein